MSNTNKYNILLLGSPSHMRSAIAKELTDRLHHVEMPSPESDREVIHDGQKFQTLSKSESTIITPFLDKTDIAILTSREMTANKHAYTELYQQYNTILETIQNSNIKRVIIVGGGGHLTNNKHQRLQDSKYYTETHHTYFNVLNHIYHTLKENNNTFDWLFMVPPEVIVPGERSGSFQYLDSEIKISKDNYGYITFQDFALAVAMEVELNRFNHTHINAAY